MLPFVTVCDHLWPKCYHSWSHFFSDKKMETKIKKNLIFQKKPCPHKKKMWPKFPNVHGCVRAYVYMRTCTYVRTRELYTCVRVCVRAHIRVHSEILVTFFFYGDKTFSIFSNFFSILSPFFYPKNFATKNGHKWSQMVTLF
jgi:hypothetical protein